MNGLGGTGAQQSKVRDCVEQATAEWVEDKANTKHLESSKPASTFLSKLQHLNYSEDTYVTYCGFTTIARIVPLQLVLLLVHP